MDLSMSIPIANQPKTTVSPREEPAIKVRKPYTISKQREKWTDEEHNKFLEALKLHGRAWRKIEEHIGTKTTVQIRSHAQKFFSKVMRESAGGNSEALNPVDIPPPRPKRKPMHPYPRKSGSIPDKALPALKKLDKSLLNLGYASDQENRSPTSVLPTFVSLSSGARDLYVDGRESATENGTKFLYRPTQEGCRSRISEGKTSMEIDTNDLKESTEPEAPVTSLKLFGRTVMIGDARKSSSCFTGSVKQCEDSMSQSRDEQVREDAGKLVYTPVLPEGDCAVLGEGPRNPWPCRMPTMFYCFPPQQEHRIAADSMGPIQVPAWVLYGSGLTTFPFLHPLNFAPPRCSEDVFQKEEGSQSASNEGPDMEARSTSNDARSSSGDRARGFVPYKRRLAEVEAEQANSSKTGEDR